MSVYVPRNARVLLAALRLGEVKPLSPARSPRATPATSRTRPNLARLGVLGHARGCAHLLSKKG